MNKNAIVALADHLEFNVENRDFDYSSGSHCVLGHTARMAGTTRYNEREYWDAAIKVFGSKHVAQLVFSGVEFKYKGDTRNFIKRLLRAPSGPEIEIINMQQSLSRLMRYNGINRMNAVKALRSLAETGEYKF